MVQKWGLYPWHRLCARVCAKPFTYITPVNFPTNQWGRCYYHLHFVDKTPDIREAIGSPKFRKLEAEEQDSHTRLDCKPQQFCLSWWFMPLSLLSRPGKEEALNEYRLNEWVNEWVSEKLWSQCPSFFIALPPNWETWFTFKVVSSDTKILPHISTGRTFPPHNPHPSSNHLFCIFRFHM